MDLATTVDSDLDDAVQEPSQQQLDEAQGHIHASPSLSDLLATKRQRVKSIQHLPSANCDGPTSDASPQQQQDQAPAQPAERQEPCQSSRPAGDALALDLGPGFSEPLLPAVFGESMSAYFQRLRANPAAVACASSEAAAGSSERPRTLAVRTTRMEADGVYLHKRPIRAPNGSSPLAVCGSVLHHVVVYVKQGDSLHSLDYGPANGADVTANVLEEAQPKRVVASGAAAAADAAADGGLPYLYLGPPARGLGDPLVQQLVAFAESRPYHAIRNNCIHFADTLVRVMTAGAVRGAPLLYDMYCGAVPPVDNPMLLMLQLMMRLSWFVVVDGSPLAAAFAEAVCAAAPPRPSQPEPLLPPPGKSCPAPAPAAAAARAVAAAAAADGQEADVSIREEAENNAAEEAAVTSVAAAVPAVALEAGEATAAAAATAAEAEAATAAASASAGSLSGAGRNPGAGAAGGAGEGTNRSGHGIHPRRQDGLADHLQQRQQQEGQQHQEQQGRVQEVESEREGEREREERRQEQDNDRAAEAAESAAAAEAGDVEMQDAATVAAAGAEHQVGSGPAAAMVAMANGSPCQPAVEVAASKGVDGSAKESQPQLPARLPSLPPRKGRKP